MNRLNTLLNKLERIPIEQIKDFALQRRVDTKFVVPAEMLSSFIQSISEHYQLLPACEQPIASYKSLYFDSDDKIFYYQHHRGQRDRFKIRIRHYIDRELSYLEVKRKTNHNITIKSRRKREFFNNTIDCDEWSFLENETGCDSSLIVPQAWINFQRITMIGDGFKERLTIDLGLTFETKIESHSLHKLAIIETKQPRFWARSPAMLALRKHGVRPSSMSKYCTAQTTLFPDLRCNRLKPSLRNIRRINHV